MPPVSASALMPAVCASGPPMPAVSALASIALAGLLQPKGNPGGLATHAPGVRVGPHARGVRVGPTDAGGVRVGLLLFRDEELLRFRDEDIKQIGVQAHALRASGLFEPEFKLLWQPKGNLGELVAHTLSPSWTLREGRVYGARWNPLGSLHRGVLTVNGILIRLPGEPVRLPRSPIFAVQNQGAGRVGQ